MKDIYYVKGSVKIISFCDEEWPHGLILRSGLTIPISANAKH
jgi:hypothetical protein